MRLIDADSLTEKLRILGEHRIERLVGKEPTVCDVDQIGRKLVEQINVCYEMQNGDMSGSNEYKYRAQGLQKALDIFEKSVSSEEGDKT